MDQFADFGGVVGAEIWALLEQRLAAFAQILGGVELLLRSPCVGRFTLGFRGGRGVGRVEARWPIEFRRADERGDVAAGFVHIDHVLAFTDVPWDQQIREVLRRTSNR